MRVAADVGGTFTDVLLRLPHGELAFHKVLSTPPAYDQPVLDGIRELVEKSEGAVGSLQEVVHGTTVATNAVLERRGGRTALYNLLWTKPQPLVERHLVSRSTSG